MNSLFQDLRYALRQLRRTPGVTAVAVLSLALGIGVTVGIYSLFDQILIRPLPVPNPDGLVNLVSPGPKTGWVWSGNEGGSDAVFSYPVFRDLERAETHFAGIAAHRTLEANLAYRDQTRSGQATLVSGSYFPLLGVQPALGRLLGAADDRTVGESRVVVLSYAYWQTHLGGSPEVLNDRLTVNGHPLTIVGVAPRGFSGTTVGSPPDVYLPITLFWLMPQATEGAGDPENRLEHWAYLFARLEPGVSLEQAQAAVNVSYRALLSDVEAPLMTGMSDRALAEFKAREIVLAPGRRGQSTRPDEARAPLTLLLAVSLIALAIASMNIANLLLTRALGRASEMAVRSAIGASRRQLIAQLLTESCLLAAIGGLLGLVVARWTLQGIASLVPAGLAATIPIHLDPTMLLFAAALTIGTGLLFGLFPALRGTRRDLASTLRGPADLAAGARSAARFRTSLATVQIALSMTLLVLAGLFTKSLMNVSRVDLGQEVDRLASFRISPERNGYAPERSRVLFERLEEELAALPAVTSVAASMVPLLASNSWGSSVSVEGFPAGPDTDVHVKYNHVGPAFFRTLGIPLMAGREFSRADASGASKVAIVNRAFARKFGLGTAAVGKRMSESIGSGADLDIEIVGLVQDAKYDEVKGEMPPQYFLPYRQDDSLGAVTFYLRTSVEPARLLPTVSQAVARLDPELPVEDLQAMASQARDNVYVDRLLTILSTAFAALATLLAVIGLYGVLAYTIAQRTREIGLRMALGAAPGQVRFQVLRQVGWMTAVGGAIGLAAALALGRAARSLLFELEGHDAWVMATAVIALVLVTTAAGYLPARRAARVDPMAALRSD